MFNDLLLLNIKTMINKNIKLTLKKPNKKSIKFKLSSQNTTIGRDINCDIVLSDCNVSRKHAKIIIDKNNTCKLIDLNSKNGTIINLFPISSIQLLNGDCFNIGKTAFILNYIN